MESSCAFDRDDDDEETLVTSFTTQHLAWGEMRELDTILPGRTGLSFDLLMALRRLTPTVRASGDHSSLVARWSRRRSALALASVYVRLAIAFVSEGTPWLRDRAARLGRALRAQAIAISALLARAVVATRTRAPALASRASARTAVACKSTLAQAALVVGASRNAMRRSVVVVAAAAASARQAFLSAVRASSRPLGAAFRVVATASPWGWATKKVRSLAS